MFGLAPYKVQIRDSQKNVCLIHRFDGKTDLATFLRAYLTRLGNTYNSTNVGKKIYQVFQWGQSVDKRSITGLIETGEHGYTARLLDIETTKTAYNRKTTEAEMLPFFFSFFLPLGSDCGVLMLERFKNFGIQKIITPDLIAAFTNEFPGYKLELSKLVPKAAAKTLLEMGDLKGIRLQLEQPPTDIADRVRKLSGHGAQTQLDSYEFVVHARRDSNLTKWQGLFDILNGKKSVAQVMSIPNWDIAGIKLDLEIDGHRRRLDLGKLGTISPVLDITVDVETDASGHPSFESIWKLSAGFANLLLLELGTDTNKTSLDVKSFTKVETDVSRRVKRVAAKA